MDDGVIKLDGTPAEVFKNVSKMKALQLDVPQSTELAGALELKSEDTILNAEACAELLYNELK